MNGGTSGPKCRWAVLPLLLLAAALAAPAGIRPAADIRAHRVDALCSRLCRPGEPGLAVLVKRDGRILFQQGYGVRDLRSRGRINPATNFRLASCTKPFTAMAIMALVRDGRLRYGDSLTSIFPEFPDYGRSITIRHLLTHTSGLPDYEDLMEGAEKEGGPGWSADRQIQDTEVLSLLARKTGGDFEPGTRWAYSNSGYVVLGLVVAKVSGMPFRDFLQRRIFAPAGMGRSVVFQAGKNAVERRAFGHAKEAGVFVERDQSATSATLGDGRVHSSLVDLGKWDDALRRNTLFGIAEMAPALVAVRLADGSEPRWPKQPSGDNLAPGRPVAYGFGWFLDPYRGHQRMWHSGSTSGFRTVIQRFTADRLTIVILCNRTDLDPKAIAEQVADIYLGR